MGDRYKKSVENKNIIYTDANNLYGWAMSQFYLIMKKKLDEKINLEDAL